MWLVRFWEKDPAQQPASGSEVYLNVIAHHCHKTSLDSAAASKQQDILSPRATQYHTGKNDDQSRKESNQRDEDDKCLYFIYIFVLFISPQLLPVVTFDGSTPKCSAASPDAPSTIGRYRVVGSGVFAPDDVRNSGIPRRSSRGAEELDNDDGFGDFFN